MSYTLEIEIDGQKRTMMLDGIPSSMILRLWSQGVAPVTLVAERVIL